MITIFNRKEVCITYSMSEQARVRDVLGAAKIPYTISTAGNNNHQTMHRAVGFDPSGGNQMPETEYKIFVNQKDYDRAMQELARK